MFATYRATDDFSKVRLLSIVTVCRNDAERLKKTVGSLRNFYGDPRFEHVVIDGLSVDNTEEVIAPLLNEINFKYKSSSDSGIYDAMNRGVDFSCAPLLLFLNCGDALIVSPDELAVFLRPLLSDNPPGFDIACFVIQQVSANKKKTLAPIDHPLYKMPTSHQGMLFEKNFITRNKYSTSYKIASDYDLYLRARCVRNCTTKFSEPLVEVEVEGLASNNPIISYREYLSIAKNRLEGWKKWVSMLRICNRALAVIFLKKVVPRSWITFIRGF